MRFFCIVAILALGVVFLVVERFQQASPMTVVSESSGHQDTLPTQDLLEGELVSKPTILTKYIYEEISKNVSTRVGDLTVTFSTSPDSPMTGDHVSMLWSVYDPQGNLVEVDPVMHTNLMHTYVVPVTFSPFSFHNHPNAQANPGYWTGYTSFSSGGEWIAVCQFAVEDTVYEVATKFFVQGEPLETQVISFERTLTRESGLSVTLETPETLHVGQAAPFEFVVSGSDEPRGEYYLSDGHNVILAKEYQQGEPIRVWNLHGDRSVEDVSSVFGIDVVRQVSEEDPFTYLLTFHETGRWFMRFEVEDQPFEFFIDVVE
jgi:hypothetical protein